MRKIINRFLIFILIINFSCAGEDAWRSSLMKGEIIAIDDHVQEERELSQLVKGIEYVQLETCSNCFINDVKQVYYANNNFYIHNRNGGLFCFDRNGQFLFQVGKNGRGPGEYLSCDQVVVKENLQKILITDSRSLRKIIEYDLNGNFIEEKKYNFFSHLNFPLNNERHFFYLGLRSNPAKKFNNHMGITTDNEFKFQNAFLPYDNKLSQIRYSNLNNGYFYEDTLSIKPDFQNVIYRVMGDTLSLRYTIDFKDKLITEEELKKIAESGAARGLVFRLSGTGKVYTIDYLLESDAFLFFMHNENRRAITNLYSKRTQRTFSQKSLIDDIGSGILNFPVGLMGEKFIFTLPAHKLYDESNEELQTKISSTLNPLAKVKKSGNINDNPVLVIAAFKSL